jgi:hypothetical protein
VQRGGVVQQQRRRYRHRLGGGASTALVADHLSGQQRHTRCVHPTGTHAHTPCQ